MRKVRTAKPNLPGKSEDELITGNGETQKELLNEDGEPVEVADVVKNATDPAQSFEDLADAGVLQYGSSTVDFSFRTGLHMPSLDEITVDTQVQETFEFEGEKLEFLIDLPELQVDNFVCGCFAERGDKLIHIYTLQTDKDDVMGQVRKQFVSSTGERLEMNEDFENIVRDALAVDPIHVMIVMADDGTTSGFGMTAKQARNAKRKMQDEDFVIPREGFLRF